MALQAVAGSKIYIGTRVASKGTVVLADFSGQEGNWTQIGGWTQSGSLGDTQETITQNFIEENRTRMIKGTRSGSSMENTFAPLPNDAGQAKMKLAEADCSPYAFKVEWSANCTFVSTVTISVATPGVVTVAGGHGLPIGSPVVFSNSGGALPTGLTVATVYYVVAAGYTATTFSVAATPGGAAIATTVAGSGTHTVTAQPQGSTDMFYGLVLAGSKNGGEANTPLQRSWTIATDSNIVEV